MAELFSQYIPGWLAFTLAAPGACRAVVNAGRRRARCCSFGWSERFRAGFRIGSARHASGAQFGWLQTLADGLKLITKEDLMPGEADRFLFKIAPYVSFAASFAAFMALPLRSRSVSLGRYPRERGRLLHPGRAWAGGLWGDPGRLFVGVEMVAVRGHARGGPSRQLRSASGPVRGRSGRCSPGSMDLTRHRRQAGRLVHQLVHLPRSVHVHHLLGLLHLCDGECESGSVRPGGSRERTGRRLPHRVFRPAVEHLLHGRVWFDAGGQPPGIDSVSGRLEWPDPHLPVVRLGTVAG